MQAMERLRPGTTAAAAAPPPADTSDISALIASEVADLKDASKQPLYWHSTGVNSVVYVELKDAGAEEGRERGRGGWHALLVQGWLQSGPDRGLHASFADWVPPARLLRQHHIRFPYHVQTRPAPRNW